MSLMITDRNGTSKSVSRHLPNNLVVLQLVNKLQFLLRITQLV
jgi:hypothetical protein